MISKETKIKFWMFMYKMFNLSPKYVCEKLNISRATFYRQKKRLSGKMVAKKR